MYKSGSIVQPSGHEPVYVAQTTTDINGKYEFTVPDEGEYNIIALIERKSVLIDSVKIIDTNSITLPTAVVQLSGSINGVILLAGLNPDNQIRATLYIPGTGLSTRPSIGGTFTFDKVPQGKYILVIEPTDIDFPVTVQSVKVAAGNQTNLDTIIIYGNKISGLPIISAGTEMTAETNDTFELKGTARDTLGKTLQYFWDVGNTGSFNSSSDGTFRTAYSVATDKLMCIFKVTDNDSNSVYDTVSIKVVAGIPVAEIDPVKKGFRAGDTIIITSKISDPFGKSMRIQWDIGNIGTFTITSNSTLKTIAPDTFAYQYPIVLNVIDNSGKCATDTIKINIVKTLGSLVGIPFSQRNIVSSSEHNFWIDSTEITQLMYDSIMATYNGYTSLTGNNSSKRVNPVSNVNWYNTVLFCNARSKLSGLDTVYSYTTISGLPGSDLLVLDMIRVDSTANGYLLPNETQWEFACRAGSTTSYYWGSQVSGDYAWYGQNASGAVHAIAQKRQNNFQLYDMSGNVAEWCTNYSDTSSIKDVSSMRTIRGGHWASGFIDVNCSARKGADPRQPDEKIGFRTIRIME
jgi:hypothetical protein